MAVLHKSKKARHRRSPSGKQGRISKENKPSPARCGVCGTKLLAVPRKTAAEMKKLARTSKRPERPFGGVLCASCSRQLYKEKIRLETGAATREQVDVRHLRFLGH